MIYTFLYILYFIIALIFIVNVLFSGRRPTKTLAWILVILLIPIGGMLFYTMFGINRRTYKFFKIKKTSELQDYLEKVKDFYLEINENGFQLLPGIQPHLKLSKLIVKNSSMIPNAGNHVSLLVDGEKTFESIFEALESATKFIHIQYYIFEEGKLADRLYDILKRKIKEGVHVRIIYDGVGSRKLSRKYIRKLQDINVQIFGFLPLSFTKVVTTINYRNHRKIIVIDGAIGFTGGINLSDKYIDGDPILGVWHDMHVRLEGPIVRSLQAVFSMDWYFASRKDELLNRKYFPDQESKGDSTVQLVYSGPDSDFSAVRQEYFTIINQAKNYVYITNSYVIPGEAILDALQTAALSGVDVRLMIPENSDNIIVKWSMRSYFQGMLRAGVRIYLYKDNFLHSKTVVADDSISSIGTANLDVRSFEQNFEVNAVIFDLQVAHQLKTLFLEGCEKSVQLNYEEYNNRSWSEKMKEGIGKVFSPLL